MKLMLVILAFVAVAQAKFLTSSDTVPVAMDKNEIDDETLTHAAMLKELLYIPMAHHVSCNNAGCNSVCQALGYKHGTCVSDTTCQCYN